MQSSSTQIKLFISYAWEEDTNNFVVKLKKDLEAEGFNVFLDKCDILAGDVIKHEVAKGIDEADGIIIVYSERYAYSKFCEKEQELAESCGKKIFPVRRITNRFPVNVELALGGIKYVKFTSDNDEAYQNSLESLIKGIKKR